MTVITLDRPQIGRNNDESFVSQTKITSNYPKMLEEKKKVFNVWFEAWLQPQVKY